MSLSTKSKRERPLAGMKNPLSDGITNVWFVLHLLQTIS